MPETQLDEDCVRKQKTTYPREHPTDNPKPPKRSKAEIQQAAKEKKEAQLAKKLAAETEKKKRILDAEEKRKLSAQRIASIEDSVQRLQKARQSRSECPDLKTMEAYHKVQKQKELNSPEVDELDDNDDMYTDGPQFLQESNIDTDSDAVRLGLSEPDCDDPPQFPPESNIDTDSDGVRLGGLSEPGDDLSDSDASDYEDSQDDEDVEEDGDSEDSMMQINRNRKIQLEKKKKGSFGHC